MKLVNTSIAPIRLLKHMVWVGGGSFLMGSDAFEPQEAPSRQVSVEGFWMDERPVTVAEFRRFVQDSGYRTAAERVASSLVYGDRGWSLVDGANWRHPQGRDGSSAARERYPVTHVTLEDAEAYAAWAGKQLPTEAEWEYAARGGLSGATYAWGDEAAPRGRAMANLRQEDAEAGTTPSGLFRPNGYGLYDMTGNVWEWTCDSALVVSVVPAGCLPPADGVDVALMVIKGGSYLCDASCRHYRPAARCFLDAGVSAGNLGFRCVVRRSR